jgi:hypothetical protein
MLKIGLSYIDWSLLYRLISLLTIWPKPCKVNNFKISKGLLRYNIHSSYYWLKERPIYIIEIYWEGRGREIERESYSHL